MKLAELEMLPAEPQKMVLLVHGGPKARDFNWFSPMNAWLTDRGYAVLQVNFRGSVGFGKNLTNAGNGEWGRKMHDDLLDAVEFAIRKQIARRDQIAIMGGSYGGRQFVALGININLIMKDMRHWSDSRSHLTYLLAVLTLLDRPI